MIGLSVAVDLSVCPAILAVKALLNSSYASSDSTVATGVASRWDNFAGQPYFIIFGERIRTCETIISDCSDPTAALLAWR